MASPSVANRGRTELARFDKGSDDEVRLAVAEWIKSNRHFVKYGIDYDRIKGQLVAVIRG